MYTSFLGFSKIELFKIKATETKTGDQVVSYTTTCNIQFIHHIEVFLKKAEP